MFVNKDVHFGTIFIVFKLGTKKIDTNSHVHIISTYLFMSSVKTIRIILSKSLSTG